MVAPGSGAAPPPRGPARATGVDAGSANRHRLELLVHAMDRGAAPVCARPGVRSRGAHARGHRGDGVSHEGILMAIHVKLDDLLHARRMTLTELSDKVDITLANLSILKTGKARAVRFSTLDAICRALDCQPGDLLQFVEE